MASALAGCGDDGAPEGFTDGSGALFMTEDRDERAQSDAQNAGTSGTDAAARQEERESSSSSSAQNLTDAQCQELENYINREDSYGFLLSSYEKPEDIDAEQVFYIGAGIESQELSEEETAAYQAAVRAKESSAQSAGSQGGGSQGADSQSTGSQDTGLEDADSRDTDSQDTGLQDADSQSADSAGTGSTETGGTDSAGTGSTETGGTDSAGTGSTEMGGTDPDGVDGCVNLLRLTAEQIDDLLQYKAGVSLQDLTEQPDDWIYLDRYKSYYINHGDEDSNLTTFEVIGGSWKGDYYTIHYREQRLSKPMDAYNVPVYEAVLKKNGDAYRFCSNRLWMQRNLLVDASSDVKLEPLGDVAFCAYEPDTAADGDADVTFTVAGNGRALFSLPGVTRDNIRSGAVFKSVEDAGFGDFNGDGNTDICVICSYSYDNSNEANVAARSDGLEARIYDGTDSGGFLYNRAGSIRLNSGVGTLNYTSARAYMQGSPLADSYDSWQEAYKASVQADDPEEYSGYALLYIDEDSIPELLKMGNSESAGARIVTFYNGTLDEKRISRTFSYLERDNMLLSTGGIDELYSEKIYGISDGRLNVVQSGSYGVTNGAVAARDTDGNPIYTYEWEGADLSQAGYRDSVSFIYDTTRAIPSGSITLQRSGEIERIIDAVAQ